MRNIYFVRHGETPSNIDRIHQGHDEPLSKSGQKQAETVAERLTRVSFDIIISSDYKRALETAQAINEKTKKSVVESPLFREMKIPSEFVQKSHSDPETIRGWEMIDEHWNDAGWHYSDEENFSDLRKRAGEAISFLEGRSEENILVVTHSTFLIMIIGVMMDPRLTPSFFTDLYEFFVTRNTGITWCQQGHPHAENPNKWQLITWNDHAHLG
ncbi:MAG: histidine phosphatase family protein [Parcubacteria group bacterium]|nr:histidine phosphatase family protein [Parcubacteria group bacterium]